jgi:tetratricopeptide (TPR) repeat protein
MRGFGKISIVAALIGAMLVATASMSWGQNLNEAEKLNKKVIELINAGQYLEAISYANRVVALQEKSLGFNHPNVAKSLNFLAGLYLSQRRYADAEPLFKRSLAIREKSLGPDHPDVAQSLNNLGVLYQAQGRYADAEVAQLKLNADWVVLSACNTAAEDKPGAEALSGLARAFFYAGARSLIVSHWEVDSVATVKLMVQMFQDAARDPKLSHSEALQQSMLAMIDSAKSDDDAHPRLWAPFVVVGEPAKGR